MNVKNSWPIVNLDALSGQDFQAGTSGSFFLFLESTADSKKELDDLNDWLYEWMDIDGLEVKTEFSFDHDLPEKETGYTGTNVFSMSGPYDQMTCQRILESKCFQNQGVNGTISFWTDTEGELEDAVVYCSCISMQ